MRTRAFPLLTAFILLCAPLDFYTLAVADVVCGNSNTYWCSEQEETYTYRWNKQGQNAQPVDNSHQGDESIQMDQGELARREEEHRRWYVEHHHGEFGLRKVRTVTSSRSGLMSLTTARTASVVMVRLARLKKPQRPGVLSRI